MEKQDVINFLRTVATPLSGNKRRKMQEVIAIVANLWGEMDTFSIVQSVNNGFHRMINGLADVVLNQRSLQLSVRKWERLALNKGWITMEDLEKAAADVNAEIEEQRRKAEAERQNDAVESETVNETESSENVEAEE